MNQNGTHLRNLSILYLHIESCSDRLATGSEAVPMLAGVHFREPVMSAGTDVVVIKLWGKRCCTPQVRYGTEWGTLPLISYKSFAD